MDSPPAFDDVYDAHLAFVIRSVAALGVPAAQVEDAAQEVFVVVLRKLAAFEPRASLKTWIYGIAVQVARSFRRTIRRQDLHQIVPLADTTIYGMEQRGEFPRRFNLTSRCVVWDLEEVEAWIEARKQSSRSGAITKPNGPDVRLRKRRPVLDVAST